MTACVSSGYCEAVEDGGAVGSAARYNCAAVFRPCRFVGQIAGVGDFNVIADDYATDPGAALELLAEMNQGWLSFQLGMNEAGELWCIYNFKLTGMAVATAPTPAEAIARAWLAWNAEQQESAAGTGEIAG